MKAKHKRMAAHLERARFYQAMMEVDYDEMMDQILDHFHVPRIPSGIKAYLRGMNELAQRLCGVPSLGHLDSRSSRTATGADLMFSNRIYSRTSDGKLWEYDGDEIRKVPTVEIVEIFEKTSIEEAKRRYPRADIEGK